METRNTLQKEKSIDLKKALACFLAKEQARHWKFYQENHPDGEVKLKKNLWKYKSEDIKKLIKAIAAEISEEYLKFIGGKNAEVVFAIRNIFYKDALEHQGKEINVLMVGGGVPLLALDEIFDEVNTNITFYLIDRPEVIDTVEELLIAKLGKVPDNLKLVRVTDLNDKKTTNVITELDKAGIDFKKKLFVHMEGIMLYLKDPERIVNEIASKFENEITFAMDYQEYLEVLAKLNWYKDFSDFTNRFLNQLAFSYDSVKETTIYDLMLKLGLGTKENILDIRKNSHLLTFHKPAMEKQVEELKQTATLVL